MSSTAKMKTNLMLLALVGLTIAARQPGWKDNTEYVYYVSGRTLTSLNDLSNQYSGIFLKAKLHVSPYPDGRLQAWISDAQYAQVQSELSDSWNTQVPESQLSYKPLRLSTKPFHIATDEGLIKSLTVEKEITNWEANVIKSIVSQFQLDLHGKNLIHSPINNVPSNEKFEGVFKTMEQTVTGEVETEYGIHRFPEYWIQSEPWILPRLELKGDGETYEIIKSKNYTNCKEVPAYHYGFGEIVQGDPMSNRMGQFYSRQSNSRIILTGKPSKYTIQSSYTVNKITVNPVLNAREQGSVISALNLTLSEVKSQTQQPRELSNPVEIGNLVYTYESPFAKSDEVRQKLQGDYLKADSSEESNEKFWHRYRRSARQLIQKLQQDGRQSGSSSEERMHHQTRPIMSEPPESPLLPYFAGYHGRSVKTSSEFDLNGNVQKIAREIGEDMQQPEMILNQSTLSKYVMLSSLVRLMNQDEIKSVFQQLYTQDKQGGRLTWVVFRDAVAEAGTGPAFLIIQEWISTKKIEGEEAADVVDSMANSVRVPTEEYMQKFFEMIQSPGVMYQDYLNETALLAYTSLLNRVYVNMRQSHNQYPVHSFRAFYTKEGKDFVTTNVIPYVSQQLNDAVSRADSRKIHVYIRALGNIGHKKVVEVFKPYLEGQKQVSQFQRMLMVLCLDKLVTSYPVVARSVLYRIYQNTGEVPEVRVAAVHQLMRTNPPFEMLQRMAENSNNDNQEEVNAAIKSAIENACELTSAESQSLRQAAESARPLLTRKQYGQRQSYNLLQNFAIKNMNDEYKQNLLQVGSADYLWPKGVTYTMRRNIGGLKHYCWNIQVMLSSLKELTNVLYMQTEKYQQSKHKRSQQSRGNKWSSDKIAETLNLKTTEREQLEGFIYTEMEYLHNIWSFDNETIQRWPYAIREKEQILKNGKQFQYSKIKQLRQMALSLPTEMGLPFLYSYDQPMLVYFEGKIRAVATPEISQGNKLRVPEEMSGQIDGFVTISSKHHSHLSVVTPFDQQIYVAGYDKNFQVHLPLKAKIDIDLQNYQAKIECELDEQHKDARLFHYSSWPYTSRSDIMSMSPVTLRPNTYYLRPDGDQHESFDFVFGKKETGIGFHVWGHNPQQSINFLQYITSIQHEGYTTAWRKAYDDLTLHQMEGNVRLVPGQSTTPRFVFKIGYQSQYNRQPKTKKLEEFLSMNEFSSKIQGNSQKWQQELLRHVSAGIKSSSSRSIAASIEFEGDKKYEHTYALAFAKSNVAPESRIVAFYRNNVQEPSQYSLQVKGYIPNTNELDLTYSLKTEPTAKYEILVEHKHNEQSSKIKATINMGRSQSRKMYLERQPSYHVCKKEMQEGNYHLYACQNTTIESNYLNDIKAELQYQNLYSGYASFINDFFKATRVAYYPMTEIRNVQSEGQNKIYLNAQFEPRYLKQLNVSIKAGDEETKFFNISLNELAKTVLIPHPEFNLKARLAGKFMGQDNIRPTCVIDETAAQTFSNKTYPLSLGSDWTVMMQYIPQQARVTGDRRVGPVEQLRDQPENFVVLVKELSEHQKEIKLIFNHPTSEGKTIEISLQLKQQRTISVLVDGQEVEFDENKAADLFNGFVEIYALPNTEVKVEIRDWFYIVYDGKRVKLTAVSDKLRDSVVGLCGRFSDDQYEDFWIPYNCIARDPKTFVESFKVEGRQQSQLPQECIKKQLPLYNNVIANSDVERRHDEKLNTNGIRFRNRYVEQNDEICFTIRPVPECKNYSRKTTTKNVPVHCITKNKTAYYLKKQIDQGGNPDFSHKSESKTIPWEIQQDCY